VGRDASGRSGGPSPRDLATLDHRIAPRLEILLDMPSVSRDVQIKHAWNQDDRSLFFSIPFTVACFINTI
jgi:hypothetical protein